MSDSVSINFGVMGDKELKESLKSITDGLRVNKTEMELVSAQYDKTGKSIEALVAKEDVLKKAIASQTDQVEAMAEALKREVKKHGESSSAAMKKTQDYNKAQAALAKMTQELKKNNQEMEEAKGINSEAGRAFQEFSKEIGEASGNVNIHKAELANVSELYTDNADSVEKATKEQEIHGKITVELAKKMQALKGQMDLLAEAGKDNTDEFKKLSEQYLDTSTNLLKHERQSKGAADGSDKLGKSVKQAGSSAQGSAKGIGAMTVAMGELVAKGIEMAITALIELTEKMEEYNMDMSRLAQNAADAGISQEILMQQMKELNFVTGETDSNVEALSNLMAAGFKENNLADAVTALSGAVIKFPDTLKIESLADGLQETLATGEATGQFAELLNRVGIEAESFNEKLQRQIKLGTEQQYVLNILSKSGLPQVADQYAKVNAEQKAYADAQFDLNESMAQIAKEMVPVMTEMTEEISSLLQEHSAEIISIIELISFVAQVVMQLIGILASVPAPVWVIIAVVVSTIALMIKFSETFGAAKSALELFTGGMTPAKQQMLMIIGVVLALASVLALLAALWLAIKEGSDKAAHSMQQLQNVQINPPTVNAPPIKKAYAKGTLSAANGWALVGEQGPELVAFGGGERVYNARQSKSLLTQGVDDNGGGAYIANLNIYPNAQQWGEVMNLLKQSKRAEQDRRKR